MKPFDLIGDVSDGKKDLIRNSENPTFAAKIYSAFLTNRAFSFHLDTILYANEMNMNYHLDNLLQHDYYLNSLKRRKRFGWMKKQEDESITRLAELEGCSVSKAKEYASVLTAEQLKAYISKHDTGGVRKK